MLVANLPAVAAQAVRRAEGVSPADATLIADANEARIAALKATGRAAPGASETVNGLELAKAVLRRAGSTDVEVDGKTQRINKVDPATLAETLDALRSVKTAEARTLAEAAIDAAVVYRRALLANSATPVQDGQGLVRTAELGLGFVGDNYSSRSVQLRIALADGYTAAGDARAVQIYDKLLATEPPPMSPSALVVRKARAQRAAGDGAGAFGTLRTLVDVFESAPASQRPPEFFSAWADMLEILAADNAGGRRSDQIRLRVAHLRSLDAKLGSTDAAERIDMVERSLR
ncbi:MAG: hypothetical protein QM783_00290 [Phycisphaerales bacterium]